MAAQDKTCLTTLTRVVALTALYFLGGLLGKESSFLSGSVALVWPPAGIALAAILLFGYRFWPGIAIGAVLFSTIDGVPLGYFTLGTAVGNTIGAIVCVFLLKRFVFFQNDLGHTRDAAGYLILVQCGRQKTLQVSVSGRWWEQLRAGYERVCAWLAATAPQLKSGGLTVPLPTQIGLATV